MFAAATAQAHAQTEVQIAFGDLVPWVETGIKP